MERQSFETLHVELATRLVVRDIDRSAQKRLIKFSLGTGRREPPGRSRGATVRQPALDRELLSAHSRTCRRGSCPMSNERKQDG